MLDAQHQSRLLSRDRLFALLALGMWGGTAIKCAPQFNAFQNINAALGLACILSISAAWPALRPDSYLRWRVPALAFLQLFLFALPFNFSTEVFDVLAPHPGTGRMAWVLNVFQLAMSIRVALLLFTSIGWRLPLPVQLPVQAAKVVMLVAFGTTNYCRSKMLSSPEMTAIFDRFHRTLAFLGTPLMPLMPASVIIPEGAFARRAAVLLLCWLVLGWLLPALLLLPEHMEERQRARRARSRQAPAGQGAGAAQEVGQGERALDALETGLRLLLPQQGPGQSDMPSSLLCAGRWWVVVQLLWGLCCKAAPLFVPAGYSSR